MSDILRLLRQAWIEDPSSVRERDDYIVIGEQPFHKSTKTNYIVWSGKDDAKKDYYTLESIFFLLKNAAQAHTIYVRNAMSERIDVIRRVDRKDMLQYLNGKIDTTTSIDRTFHMETPSLPSAKKTKLDHDFDPQSSTAAGAIPLPSDGAAANVGDAMHGLNETATPSLQTDDVGGKRSTPSDPSSSLPPPHHQSADPHITSSDLAASLQASSSKSSLSLDKIASIKAKFMRQQQKKSDTVADSLPDGTLLDGAKASGGHAALDSDFKTKSCRSRSSVTSTHAKSFYSNIIALVAVVRKKEALNTKRHAESLRRSSASSASYNRYTQEKFTSNELSEFGIPAVSGSASRASTASHSQKTEHRSSSSSSKGKCSVASQIPIIIVPPQTVSPFVGLSTVQSLLTDFKYVESKLPPGGDAASESKMYIYRKASSNSQGAGKPYQIVDQPLKVLCKDDWKRVICVFVHGPTWQFKKWPFKGGIGEIFQNMKGIHCKWTNAPLDKNVSKMNVETFEFNTRSRHTDFVTVKKMWTSIDQFAAKHKPNLDI